MAIPSNSPETEDRITTPAAPASPAATPFLLLLLFAGREQGQSHQHAPMNNSLVRVDLQHVDGRSPFGGLAKQPGSLPLEMIGPAILAGIEKTDKSAAMGIKTCGVTRFIGVARGAGQAEVPERRVAVVFRSADMIEFVRQIGATLRQPAVLAAATGPLPNAPAT